MRLRTWRKRRLPLRPLIIFEIFRYLRLYLKNDIFFTIVSRIKILQNFVMTCRRLFFNFEQCKNRQHLNMANLEVRQNQTLLVMFIYHRFTSTVSLSSRSKITCNCLFSCHLRSFLSTSLSVWITCKLMAVVGVNSFFFFWRLV